MDLEHVARFVVAPELVEIDDLTAQDRRQLPALAARTRRGPCMAPSGSLEAVEPLRATDHVRHLHDDHCPPHGHSVKSPHAPPRTILSICI